MPNREQDPPGGGFGPGRKVRTADCRECRIWRGLLRAGLPAAAARPICERMWLHRVRRGQTLYLEGNRATHLYALRRGTVKLLKLDAQGREHVTAVLGSGALFGFEAAFDDIYATGAEAHEAGELCLIAADELRELMRELPGFAFDLAGCLYRRWVGTQQRQAYLANPGARARLAGYLLSRAAGGDGGSPCRVPHELTLRELGGMVGLSPETVCRTIGALRTAGVIEVGAGEILIREPDALLELAAGS
ncbi:MAG: Crp/Fnr family transcriptional regulator [Acidobacteriota bacterium]|nr:Crp/Fnr family transcriptional regulator [Acidobacteriota bacterium]MDH3524025.1 Crp/Fnr family transcriptional regulator [Acidobacteriota bacterium]